MGKRNHHKEKEAFGSIVSNVIKHFGESGCEVKDVGENERKTPAIGRKERRRLIKKQRKSRQMESVQNAFNSDETGKTNTTTKKRTRQKRKGESGATKRKRKRAKLQGKEKGEVAEKSNEDDRTIHSLEKLIKIKTKKLPSSFASDGLDFILDVIGQGETESGLNDLKSESPIIHHSDDENSDVDPEKQDGDVYDDDDMKSNDDGSDDSENEEMYLDNENCLKDDEDHHVNYEDDEQCRNENDEILDHEVSDDEYCEDEEDIISVKSSTETKCGKKEKTASVKYVPPALRVKLSDKESEKRKKIERQITGWLNRLSESNLGTICLEISAIYQVNSRAFVTEILTDQILVQFLTPDPIPERLITESSMLVAILCHDIGLEVVAHFIETACKKLQATLLMDNYGKGKECNNLVQLICSLYQLQAVQKQIVLDLVQKFIDGFTEKDIEILVLILKNVGFQLRKDNPILLKEIVEKITKKSKDLGETDSSRTKYMLEILTAIKNNNVRKITEYDVETVNSRRKKIKTLIKSEKERLQDVTFKDLVNCDAKGRWWIVGSSWAGVPMLKRNIDSLDVNANVSAQLVSAARRLRMNTDVRKAIFYAVMSAEDYMDAFERITKLDLKDKQLRDVSHVIVECCVQQKSFNHFYFHLLNKFCHYNREFVMTTQCTFWDKFKLLQSYTPMQMANLSSLVANLILSQAIPLACLKTLEYTEMDKGMVTFLRQVLTKISKSEKSESKIEEIFPKLGSSKHSLVRQGLKLFIQHFMLNDAKFMKDHADITDLVQKMNDKLVSAKAAIYG